MLDHGWLTFAWVPPHTVDLPAPGPRRCTMLYLSRQCDCLDVGEVVAQHVGTRLRCGLPKWSEGYRTTRQMVHSPWDDVQTPFFFPRLRCLLLSRYFLDFSTRVCYYRGKHFSAEMFSTRRGSSTLNRRNACLFLRYLVPGMFFFFFNT